jgi:hypothetical protein
MLPEGEISRKKEKDIYLVIYIGDAKKGDPARLR